MNKIISLKQMSDCEVYNPILTLNEDLDYDNRFAVICTNVGSIAFSYYDLGIAPKYIIHDTTLFLCFGKSYYILDLKIFYQKDPIFLYKDISFLKPSFLYINIKLKYSFLAKKK